MNKDVIYIDIEDDITSIIERLKSSPEKIVALVPPKGSSVLQSIVNLKLLKRAADSVDKKSVIVTSNGALQTLAGGVGLYFAKNLQSKPILAGADPTDQIDDDAVEVSDAESLVPDDIDDEAENVELSDEELASLESEDGTGSVPLKDTAKKKPKKNKVPNFDSFRKKLLIGAGIGLVLLLVLLFVFGRSKANVVVRAETTPVDVQFDMTVDTALSQSNPDTAQVKAVPQEQKKTATQSFTPTGKKDLGTKASGSMTFSIKCSDVTSFPTTIPAGTGVTASGLTFVTQSAASLSNPAGGGGCKFTGSANVVSQDNGDKYNLSSRTYSVSGFSNVTGTGSDMTGGTSRIVTTVSQDDINKATEQLKQQDSSGVKAELSKEFKDGTRVLDDTFTVSVGSVTSSPALNGEGNEASLSAEVTYSILGINSDDLSNAMNINVVSQMSNPDQQSVYDNGYKNVKLEKKSGNATSAVYTVSSVAQYGPQFDTSALAEQIADTKAGEARSTLQSLPGVKSVDINLSPFWSNKLPNSSKIKIKIDVDKTVSG